MKKLILAACVTLGLAASGGMDAFRGEPQAGPEPRGINAHAVRQAFDDNPQEAEKRYIGQTFNVEGYVVETGMSIYATPNVRLSGEQDGPVEVNCVLPRLDMGKLSNFSKGQKVVMSGRGYRLSERGVVVKECKQVK